MLGVVVLSLDRKTENHDVSITDLCSYQRPRYSLLVYEGVSVNVLWGVFAPEVE